MSYERIILDVETQRDFFLPGGALYTSKASAPAQQIYRLFTWARQNNIPVISTVLRVRRNERGPISATPHCIDDTEGEKKISRTILPRRVNLGLLNTTDLPDQIFGKFQQVIFEKRDTDIFAHARAERLISELGQATFIICGAGLAYGIAQAAVGLRSRNFGVIVAADAVLDLNPEMSEMARLRMEAKGAIFAPTSEIVAPTPQHRAKPFRVPVVPPVIEAKVEEDEDQEDEPVETPRRRSQK